MTTPNFFIIGAPKCGTTALSEYLRAHPQVFMSNPKEVHYFATDFPEYRFVDTWQDYLRLFEPASVEHRAIGEASVFHMYSECAVANILDAIPDAKLIVLLRNPMELAVSMHAQAAYTGDDLILDFDSAWAARAERGRGEIPFYCRDVKPLTYNRVALLGQQLERALAIAPKGQLRWWFYDDFAARTRDVYCDILNYLSLDDDGQREFARINPRSERRYRVLTWVTQRPPKSVVNMAMGAKQVLGIERLGIMDAISAFNSKAAEPKVISKQVKDEMYAEFAPDIRLLSDITGRNLDHWLS